METPDSARDGDRTLLLLKGDHGKGTALRNLQNGSKVELALVRHGYATFGAGIFKGLCAVSGVVRALSEPVGRRAWHRLSVAVPALIRVGELTFTAKLANIGRGGGMLETAAPILVGAKITLCCGTIVAGAAVMWRGPAGIGVNFDTPLSHTQLQEQVSRSAALAAL